MPAYSLSSLSEYSTLVDLLTFRASQPGQSPDNPVFSFLETGDGASETVTLTSLDRRARSIAAHLRDSVRPGDRILLVYPPGPEFIAAFWGCVYAGGVAVPALPATNARTLPRLHAIVTDAQPNMVLVSASVAGRQWIRESGRLTIFNTKSFTRLQPDTVRSLAAAKAELWVCISAFLIDEAAIELQIDPIVLRQRNALAKGGYTVTGFCIPHSLRIAEMCERARRNLLWTERDLVRQEYSRQGMLYGVGFALANHSSWLRCAGMAAHA